MAQYQYVVMYDSSTEQWEVDVDTVQDLNDRLFYDSEHQDQPEHPSKRTADKSELHVVIPE